MKVRIFSIMKSIVGVLEIIFKKGIILTKTNNIMPKKKDKAKFNANSHINKAGLEIIKKYEGLRLTKYVCPAGKVTIGYGHSMKPGEVIPRFITNERAEELLLEDIELFEDEMRNLIEIDLDSNQWSAIVSFVYNVGATLFASSSVLKKINERDAEGVVKALKKYVYYTDSTGEKVVAEGLKKRRDSEAKLYLS